MKNEPDQITIEYLRKAREIMDRQKAHQNLGFICPYCNCHVSKGDILNPKYHEDNCPVRHGEGY